MRAVRLECFATGSTAVEPDLPDLAEERAEARLATYEEGYAAGWEDAAATQRDDRAQAEEEALRALAALSLGVDEVRRQILASLAPLLDAVVAQIVPALARESLAARVAEAILPLAAERAGGPVTLRLHPAARAVVAGHLQRLSSLSLVIEDDPALRPEQALVSIGTAGAHVDLSGMADEIAATLRAFNETLPLTENPHG
ncbi:MAG: hypothetical protein RIR62_3085 [Pseudomonadota bacterium]|jgi:flagellar assembly protein FliH